MSAPTWTILEGDCRDVLATLPAGSVHTVVTSPPYFGLRDYGTGEWKGGDPACDHKGVPLASAASRLRNDGRQHEGLYDGEKKQVAAMPMREACARCGARRVDRQIGLEPTPDEFVQALVEVFREVRRVLRDDGTVWLNLGDSYAGSPAAGWREGSARADGEVRADEHSRRNRNGTGAVDGCKPKDLIGIPWRVAFALQADGWYLRSEVIWHKLNPMPESVTDRPTKAHEQIFLLSKSPRYFYDADAIREPARDWGERDRTGPLYDGGVGPHAPHAGLRAMDFAAAGRNKRDVWTVSTKPYAGAHFATFPPDLIEPCVLAGSPERACSACGAPWERIVATCSCDADYAPGVVLDPFNGAGTTGLVAVRHGREYIGIELNPEYAALARDRIATDVRLGHRPPQRAPDPVVGQASIFDLKGDV